MPGLLGHRNEFGRRDHAAFGIRPAHQRLEAGDAPARKTDQRLIIRPQHVVLDRVAQVEFGLAPALGARVHSGLEETERTARIVLGSRQRHVGALQKFFGFVAVARRRRNADAGADDDGMAVEQIGIGDRLQQPLGEDHGILGARQPAVDDREFVGVETGQRIFLAQRRAQALGDPAQQLVADAVAQRVVNRLEIVQSEHQHRDLFGAAPRVQQDLVHVLAQQVAVRQAGQAIVLGHEGKSRLGALALGDVHQRQQHRGLVVIDQMARIDRQIDQGAVGPHVLPGARRQFVAGKVAGPGRFGFESLNVADGQLLELGAAIAVMLDRGVVDAEDALVVHRANDHGNGIAVEQQPERGFTLLQLGDVDAQTDDTAIPGQPLLDQDDAAIAEDLLVPFAGVIKLLEPFGDPFLFATDRFGIVAALDTDADGILEPRARLEQVRTAVVDFGVFLVPEDVASLGVEEHDALRQDVERLAQAFVGFPRFGDRSFRFRALAHDLANLGRHTPAAAQKLRTRFGEPTGNAGDRRMLPLLDYLRPDFRH